jgi:hypothetical protein
MSIETWKKEFYPVTADKCPKNKKAALRHAFKKWRGLLKKNLRRHGLIRQGSWIGSKHDLAITKYISSGILVIDGDTCALCKMYEDDDCNKGKEYCPLVNNSDWWWGGSGCERAWEQFVEWGRATPMLKRIVNAMNKHHAWWLAGK